MHNLGDRLVAIACVPAAVVLIAHLTGLLEDRWAAMEDAEQARTVCAHDGQKWRCIDQTPVHLAWRG